MKPETSIKDPGQLHLFAYYPFFKCPSDPLAKGRAYFNENSYVICDGAVTDQLVSNGFATGNGGDATRARDITDGLSNTIAFSERLVAPAYLGKSVDVSELPQTWIRLRLDVSGTFVDRDAFVQACLTSARPAVPLPYFDAWGFATVLPPNSPGCHGGRFNVISATSLHPGGVNVLFADGSGRFISNDIDLKLWNALGTRAGNETLSLAAY